MKKSSSWEANGCSECQDIPQHFCPKYNDRVQQKPTTGPSTESHEQFRTEELRNLHSSPRRLIATIKWTNMKHAGHVKRMGEMRNATNI